MSEEKGFLAQLFDFSFKSFITVKIIRILYLLTVIGAGLIGLVVLLYGFSFMNISKGAGFFLILLAPGIFFLITIWARVLLELTVIFFRIEANTSELIDLFSKYTTPVEKAN